MKTTEKKVSEHTIREFMVVMLSNGMPSALSLIFEDKKSARQFYKFFRKLELKALDNIGLSENEATDTDDVFTWEENVVHFNHLIEDLYFMKLIKFNATHDVNGETASSWIFNYRELILMNIEITTNIVNSNRGLRIISSGKVVTFSLTGINDKIDDLLRDTGVSPNKQ